MSVIIGISIILKIHEHQNFSTFRIKTSNSLSSVFRLILIFVGLITVEIIVSIGLSVFISDQILCNQIYLFSVTILLTVLLWLVKSKADYTKVRRFSGGILGG